LFYRYRHLDDFGAPETTFLATAFWRAEALVCVGRLQEAQEALLTLRTYANSLGLYSEDVGLDGSQWGNFPQTYSHVGLMTATARLARRLDLPFFEDQPQ
jgi:glucoamylase